MHGIRRVRELKIWGLTAFEFLPGFLDTYQGKLKEIRI